MKKLFIIIGIIFVIFLGAAFALPLIFKDDILAAVDKAIDNSVNAEVYYDPGKFDLTLFKNFPNVTVSMGDFGVVGVEEFAGDTLADIQSFDLIVNLKSVIFDEQPRISGIHLDQPRIYVKVLENGKANYDIAKPSEEETVAEDTTTSNVSIGIDEWKITDGRIVYDDRTLPFYMELDEMNHTGSGDFTLDVFDMKTETNIERAILSYDGVAYVSGQSFDADIDMNMDLENFKFTFSENTVKLNDFALGFDGFLAMPSEDIDMDITFAAKDNSFKSLLSLVPATYQEGYEGIETEGDFDFHGFVKGTYNDETMPAFNVVLNTENAMFHYPDLPTAVKNISIDLLVDNKDGNIDNTVVNLKKMHADFGNNPIDARLLLEGLDEYKIDTEVTARLNLGELSTMFPMEGTEMKGIFNLALKANGVYDSVANRIPTIDMDMRLQDGFVKSAEYPLPLDQIRFASSVKNTSGNMAETVIEVNDFHMLLDEEELTADLVLQNLDDYTWDLNMKGGIDLEKLTQVYPMEDMTLAGVIRANIETKGKMSDVEAERYAQLPTSGTVSVQNFSYTAPDFPQGFKISDANATFNPDKIELNNFDGAAGSSDLHMDGFIANYISYLFKENETIRGELNFKSGRFDANEWMTEEESAPVAEADTASEVPMEVVEVPKDIDFVLRSSISEVLYDNLTLQNLRGNIIVRDGVVRMDGVNFNSLGGSFAMDGAYDTRDMSAPAFNFDFGIDGLEFKQAYTAFNTVQKLAPIAEKMEGEFSTDMNLKGLLASDMSPVLNTLTGNGILEIADAALTESKLIAGITSVTKLSDTDQMTLKDTEVQFEIEDGRVFVEPFDVNFGNIKTVIAGSNGIDGSLDYLLKMNVPAGAVGSAVNQAIAKLTGANGNVSSNLLINLKVGGNYDDPKVTLAGAEAGESTTGQAKQAVAAKIEAEKEELKKELDKQKEEAEAKAKAEAERLKKEAEEKARKEAERLKKEAEEKARKQAEKLSDEAKKELEKAVPDSTKEEVKDKLKKLFK